jgi:hypothetical protein
MSAYALGDESLKRFCQGMRKEVEADGELAKRSEKHFFTPGDAIKTYAASLGEEMERNRSIPASFLSESGATRPGAGHV